MSSRYCFGFPSHRVLSLFLVRLYVLWNFVLFWISVLNVQSEGKVCFKERKGRSQLVPAVTRSRKTVILFWALSIPHPKKILFGSLSLFVHCHIRASLFIVLSLFSSCSCQVNVAGLWMFRHHLSDGIPHPNSMHFTQPPLIVSLHEPKAHLKALLFCAAILNPDPEMRCLLSYCFLDYVRRKFLEGWKV